MWVWQGPDLAIENWVYPYFSAAQVPGDKSCDGADSEIQKDCLDQFDCKLLNPSLQKVADKRGRTNSAPHCWVHWGRSHVFFDAPNHLCTVASETSCGHAHYGKIILKVTHYSSPSVDSFSLSSTETPGRAIPEEVHIKNLPSLFKKPKANTQRQMRWMRRVA